jgi:hypothetical protein
MDKTVRLDNYLEQVSATMAASLSKAPGRSACSILPNFAPTSEKCHERTFPLESDPHHRPYFTSDSSCQTLSNFVDSGKVPRRDM